MSSPQWTHFMLGLILLTFVNEIAANGPSKYLRRIFAARQLEAKRNRLKYENITLTDKDAADLAIHPGFFVHDKFTQFIAPKLHEDLTQTFSRANINDFFLDCRKGHEPKDGNRAASNQRKAIEFLKFGRAFWYSPTELTMSSSTTDIELIPTPMSVTEKRFFKDYSNICKKQPAPSIKPIKRLKDVHGIQKISTGEGGIYECKYFELGIESVQPYTRISAEVEKTLKKNRWINLYNSCYDYNNFAIGFTKHTIISTSLEDRKLNPNVIRTEAEDVFVDKEIRKAYDLANQRASFTQQDRKKELEAFNEESNYLVRARLIPDHDLLYETWQYVTHNYLNYAPQWRLVNFGQWLKVEQDIRNMARKARQNITVYTGVIYKKNSAKLHYRLNDKEVKSVPIPSHFYKYVHTDEAGIVLITANGPSGTITDITCVDVCSKYEWYFSEPAYEHRNQEEHGVTKCCIPTHFFKDPKYTIPQPDDIKTKILTFGGLPVDNDNLIAPPRRSVERPSTSGYDPSEQFTRVGNYARPTASRKNTYLIGQGEDEN